MKTAIKTFLSFIVLFSFFFSEAQTQDSITHSYIKNYTLRDAYKFASDHGIKVDPTITKHWDKIIVEVKTR
jgi:spermidine/putrescine-binding protein